MPVQAIIDLPDQLYRTLSSHGLTKEAISRESKKLLALKCYKDRVLSLGKSAELSGLSLWEFIEFLGKNDLSNCVVLKKHEQDIKTQSIHPEWCIITNDDYNDYLATK